MNSKNASAPEEIAAAEERQRTQGASLEETGGVQRTSRSGIPALEMLPNMSESEQAIALLGLSGRPLY